MPRVNSCISIILLCLTYMFIISAPLCAERWIDAFASPGPANNRYEPAWQDIGLEIGRYFSPVVPNAQKKVSHPKAWFTEGTIEVNTALIEKVLASDERVALQKITPTTACTGLLIKSIEDDSLYLLLGDKDQIKLTGTIGGKPFAPEPKAFPIELNKDYHIKAQLLNGRIVVWVDEKQYFDEAVAISAKPGKTGLYCESPAWFDNYEITGIVYELPSDSVKAPKFDILLSRFRSDNTESYEVFSTHGAIEIYLKNTGEGAARLLSMELNGEPVEIESQVSPVAWFEQFPVTLKPGESGCVYVRMRGLPADVGEAVLRNPKTSPKFKIKATWEGGSSKTFDIPYSAAEPVQINFVAFSEDLKKVWVYLQNNDWHNENKQVSKKIKRIIVDGKDVTATSVLGEKEVKRDIVPVLVNLDQPLEERKDTIFLVEFSDGSMTGHCVRSIPSKTLLQVSVWTSWTGKEVLPGARADWMEDIYYHCANTIGVVGKKYDHLSKMKKLGLWAGGMGSLVQGFGGWGRNWLEQDHPEIVAMWCDEVDKHATSSLYYAMHDMRRWQESLNQKPPLHLANFMQVWGPGSKDVLDMMDAVMHGYEWIGGFSSFWVGEDFGRYESMSWREFRRARKPFFPYLRDAEIYVQFDTETKQQIAYSRGVKRIVSPDEERWMNYGNMMQGAKGVFHWGYGSVMALTVKGGGLHFRFALGGPGAGHVWEYQLKPETVKMVLATWDEIGRINAEWQAVAPLIAISDVTDRAKVVECTPATNPQGKSAASAVALVAGLDSMIVLALNQNIQTTGLMDAEPSQFPPVDATIAVDIPSWLKPVDIFRVTCDGITDLSVKPDEKNQLKIQDTIKVNDMIVITGDPNVKKEVAGRLKEMQERLEKGRNATPVHTDVEKYF